MPNALEDIRKRINIHKPPDDMINDNNRLFSKGCKAEGVCSNKFELNIKDSLECGFCAMGCKYDRKMGTMIT